MFRSSLYSIPVALQTLRANPLHTLLSTLGIVIGVASLVAILAFADGLERTARDQIAGTTDVQRVSALPNRYETIDGMAVQRANVPVLSVADVRTLNRALADSAELVLMASRTVAVQPMATSDTSRVAARLFATTEATPAFYPQALAAGRFFNAEDVDAARPVVVLSALLAHRLGATPEALVGQRLVVGGTEAEVVGVLGGDTTRAQPLLSGPLTAFADSSDAPQVLAQAHRVEDVPLVEAHLAGWLAARFGEGTFTLQTNATRVEQVTRGMLLFKLVMGLITGISVVVGGIGVMNVLLMSVTERTREIGIRKATGALRRDIVLQFLTEAVAISSVGSLIGLGLGLLTAFAAMPILRSLTAAHFQMAVSPATLGVVALVALTVGLVFGTYPAWRAARLQPVDAIRHE